MDRELLAYSESGPVECSLNNLLQQLKRSEVKCGEEPGAWFHQAPPSCPLPRQASSPASEHTGKNRLMELTTWITRGQTLAVLSFSVCSVRAGTAWGSRLGVCGREWGKLGRTCQVAGKDSCVLRQGFALTWKLTVLACTILLVTAVLWGHGNVPPSHATTNLSIPSVTGKPVWPWPWPHWLPDVELLLLRWNA